MSPIKPLLLIICLCYGRMANSQTHIDFYTGLFTDLANKNQFQQLNLGVQTSVNITAQYQFFIQLQASPALLSKSYSKPAFTPNPQRPLQINVQEKIAPTLFSFAIGHRFLLGKPAERRSSWHILLLTGFGIQGYKTKATIPEGYALLNAEVPQSTGELFAGLGAEWQYTLKDKGRFFVQLNGNFYPFRRLFKDPSAFNIITPLQLNVGYGIKLPNKKK